MPPGQKSGACHPDPATQAVRATPTKHHGHLCHPTGKGGLLCHPDQTTPAICATRPEEGGLLCHPTGLARPPGLLSAGARAATPFLPRRGREGDTVAYAPPPASLPDSGLVRVWDYSFIGLTTPLPDPSDGLNVSGAESAVGVFEGSVGLPVLRGTSAWDTRSLRNASRAFAGLPALAELDLSRWRTARLEDVSWLFDGSSALTRTGVGGWTSLQSLSRFDRLFQGLGADFRESLAGWRTPALADCSADCARLAPYTALSQAQWPAACSRSFLLALARVPFASTVARLGLSPTAGSGPDFTRAGVLGKPGHRAGTSWWQPDAAVWSMVVRKSRTPRVHPHGVELTADLLTKF
eukprot:g16437.t1